LVANSSLAMPEGAADGAENDDVEKETGMEGGVKYTS